MKDISKPQITAIQTALRAQQLQEQKQQLVLQYTGQRTSSVAAMYFSEAQELLKMLNGQRQPPQQRDKLIRSIIAMAREMGVIVRKAVVNDAGVMEEKSDYSQFNQWLLTKSTAKKASLNHCSTDELLKLVNQYKAIYKDWLRKHH
jgi:hypothetical protein